MNSYSSLSSFCGVSMGILGNFEEGKLFLEKGLGHAAQINDLATLRFAEIAYGIFFDTKGDWKAAMGHFQSSIKYSQETKFSAALAWSWSWLGHAYCYLGDPETGRRYVEKGIKIQRDSGSEWYFSWHPYFLGDIFLKLGDLKNARSLIDEALRLSQKNNEKWTEGSSWLTLGRILGRTEAPEINAAEESIFHAVKIFDELKIKPYNALSHFYLGEFYGNVGQKEKALKSLKKAETMFQEMGMDYWLGRTRELLESVGA